MSFNELLEKIAAMPSVLTDAPAVPPPELVAFFVRVVRGMKQWKQSTLADFAQVSLSTIERVERGEKVSNETLDRISAALGYGRGYFTAPRYRKSVEEAVADLEDTYDHLESVDVRPLRNHAQVRAIARCDALLVHRPDVGADYDDGITELAEWFDLASFILSEIGGPAEEKGRRRELYNDILACVHRIERCGINALCGVMRVPQDARSDWKVAVLSLTPKRSDPAASKRKVIFVDRRSIRLPSWREANAGLV